MQTESACDLMSSQQAPIKPCSQHGVWQTVDWARQASITRPMQCNQLPACYASHQSKSCWWWSLTLEEQTHLEDGVLISSAGHEVPAVAPHQKGRHNLHAVSALKFQMCGLLAQSHRCKADARAGSQAVLLQAGADIITVQSMSYAWLAYKGYSSKSSEQALQGACLHGYDAPNDEGFIPARLPGRTAEPQQGRAEGHRLVTGMLN